MLFLMALISEVAFMLTVILKRSGDNAVFLISSLPLNAQFRRAGAGEAGASTVKMLSSSNTRVSLAFRSLSFLTKESSHELNMTPPSFRKKTGSATLLVPISNPRKSAF